MDRCPRTQGLRGLASVSSLGERCPYTRLGMRSIPVLRQLDASAKLAAKEQLPGWLLSRVRPNAVRTARGDARHVHGEGQTLYAMVCTWNEEDIIHATVRNAFELGAERVFLLDNGSTDDTVVEAEAAGATHVLTFVTESFDELFKYRLINEFIEHLSGASGHDRLWWLLMDADEFVTVPNGGPLLEHLATVDERCRVLGARVLDHYPTPGVAYEPRTHPIDVQPMCREKVDHRCSMGHHKHPVFLWDRERKRIIVEPGFHQLRCVGEALYEPDVSLVLHHFPFRNEVDSRRRLDLLARRGSTAATQVASADAHMVARRRSLDAVYAGRYDEIIDYRTGKPGITVEDWRKVVAAESRD